MLTRYIRTAMKAAHYEILAEDGVFYGEIRGRHQFMLRGSQRLPMPNPHCGDIGRQLLGQTLLQAGIWRDEWEKL